MKVFHCDHCDHLVFFENSQCVSCGRVLAFVPELMDVCSLDPVAGDAARWRSAHPGANGRLFRLCANYSTHQVCNWTVEADDANPLCRSCRLTTMVPDLTVQGHLTGWFKLEVAKRRVVHTLIALGLPVEGTPDVPPLNFQFLAHAPAGDAPVLTGHDNGVVTVNIAEADDAERERRRASLGEPYRTLLGHLRHEVGHYYWMRLVEQDGDRLARFRALFGNDEEDYGQALQRHYTSGPPADWPSRFVSAYASAHPWEDWAETWAHYLHMTDTLETAAACGVSLRPHRSDEPTLPRAAAPPAPRLPFARLADQWFAITYLLNNLSRGLGVADPYPFVLSPSALDKLCFVHGTVGLAAGRTGDDRTPVAGCRG